MDAQEAQKELLAAIGLAVVQTQTSERLMNLAFTHILDLGPAMTLERIVNLRKKKLTVGQIVREMQKYVELNDEFKDVLTEFIDKRNSIVHRIDGIDGFSLNKPEGMILGLNYVGRFLELNDTVLRVFKSLAVHWAALNPDLPQMDFEAEISAEALNTIFFRKGD